jgi:hypothetical protein
MIPYREIVGFKNVLEVISLPVFLNMSLNYYDPLCVQAVHPISNLYDLKRRLGSGRRCFGYFHPSIPGKNVKGYPRHLSSPFWFEKMQTCVHFKRTKLS